MCNWWFCSCCFANGVFLYSYGYLFDVIRTLSTLALLFTREFELKWSYQRTVSLLYTYRYLQPAEVRVLYNGHADAIHYSRCLSWGDFFSQLCAMSFHKAATIFIKFFFLVFFPWNSCVVTVPAMGPKSLRFCINFMEIVINDASTAWRLARILLLYMIYLSMRVFYSEFFDDDFQLKPKIVGKHPDKINTFYCRIYQLNILFPKCYWNIENDWKYWKWWKTIEITK